MRKRTVIISKINDDRTAYVINVGIEELSLFKNLYDNGLELVNKDSLSDEEILMLLRHCNTDGFVECVISVENHFNRDQKQINIYKSNIEQKLKSKGYTIVQHCDWKPSFKTTEDFVAVINSRNYLTMITEEAANKEKEIEELDEDLEYTQKLVKQEKKEHEQLKKEHEQLKAEFDKLTEQSKNLEKTIQANTEILKVQNEEKEQLSNELEELNENEEKLYKKSANLEREIENQEEEKEQNRKKINQQNWYIEQTKTVETEYTQLKKEHEQLKAEFDKLTERYKKGEEICKKQEEEAREKWPDELKGLKKEIDKHQTRLDSLMDACDKKSGEIYILTNDTINLEKEIDKLNKINANLKEVISQNIEKVVTHEKKKYHIDNLSMEDKIEKFKTTCEMYKLNDWDMPEFEIKFAKSYGLTDDVIQQILNISK